MACDFVQNKSCEYFPCHAGVDLDKFSCLFCYCPLYALGKECGGNFRYIAGGIKDCSECLVPHSKGGYDYVTGNFMKIVEKLQKDEADAK